MSTFCIFENEILWVSNLLSIIKRKKKYTTQSEHFQNTIEKPEKSHDTGTSIKMAGLNQLYGPKPIIKE